MSLHIQLQLTECPESRSAYAPPNDDETASIVTVLVSTGPMSYFTDISEE